MTLNYIHFTLVFGVRLAVWINYDSAVVPLTSESLVATLTPIRLND